MMTKEEYKRELIRMWDSIRTEYIGRDTCKGVLCKQCRFRDLKNCASIVNAFEAIEIVERWSKEHQQKKYKVSRMEYDILKSYLDYKNHMTVDIADYFFEDGLLLSLLKKGYFKGATKETLIKDYLNDCEVVGNVR